MATDQDNTSTSADAAPAPRQLVAEMAELIGGLAHELRNPLSTMMVNLKLLAEDLQDLGTDAEHMRRRALLKVETLSREAERLQSLFDQFMHLTDPERLRRCETDVNTVVTQLVEFFGPTVESQGISVDVDLAPGPLPCPIDGRSVRQALLNILINAQQAMPDGGRLGVATAADDSAVSIRISDTGVGIADTDRDRILRPFFSTKARGHGLGLSITQRIIHDHGGSLSFESAPGKGTTFTIRLPRHTVEPD